MANDTAYGTQPVVAINGVPLPEWAVPLLEQAVIDTHVHLPDMMTMKFRDEMREVLQKLGVQLGSKVSVSAGAMGSDQRLPLIVAEVTGFEHEHGPRGSFAVLHGYDLSHRLSRGRNTRSWQDVTDSSIAVQLAQAAGLEVGQVDATSIVHPHVSQVNLTDWEFMKARAQETGYEVAVVLGKFEWRKPTPSQDAPPPADLSATTNQLQLVVGQNLLQFRPRMTSSGQVQEVEVRGWDPIAKQPLTATVATKSASAKAAVPQQQVASVFGAQKHLASDASLHTQADVTAKANALADTIGSGQVEADGIAIGDPHLVAGAAVSISLAGWPYDGTYALTTARHVFNREGYRTHITISGRSERSLLGLTSMGATKGASSAGGQPIYGVVVGVVTDVKDPEGLGRVRVRFPWLSDDYVSYWARVAQLGAGSDRGASFLSEVGDEVLCAFDRGDTRTPFVIGQLHNGADKPNGAAGVDKGSGQVSKRALRSRKGHAVVFDEEKGIVIRTGSWSAWIGLGTDGVLEVETTSDIKVTSKGKVNVKSTGDITLESDANIHLKATQNVVIESTMSATISGGLDAKVTGPGGSVELSPAGAAIKGTIVTLN
jgi:phage protein D